jgi:hypothetical protein
MNGLNLRGFSSSISAGRVFLESTRSAIDADVRPIAHLGRSRRTAGQARDIGQAMQATLIMNVTPKNEPFSTTSVYIPLFNMLSDNDAS